MHFRKLTLFFAFILFIQISFAQRTSFYTENPDFKRAMELFNAKQFAQAQSIFSMLTKNTIPITADLKPLLITEAQYYAALCAIKLNNTDGGASMIDFVEKNPSHPKNTLAYFHIGGFYFDKGIVSYTEALKWFEKVDEVNLSGDELNEYQFKTGYSYFILEDYLRAQVFFQKVKEKPSIFYDDANYYYAYIAYKNRNYQTALIHFDRIKSSEKYFKSYPVYASQINLALENYDVVIGIAEPIIQNDVNRVDDGELSKVLGAAYFNKENYAQAELYFRRYLNSTRSNNKTNQDSYQIGYTFYINRKYNEAITELSNFNEATDAFSHNALLTLADAYLKINDKIKAREAFEKASLASFDKQIQEDALLNFAKLSFELQFQAVAIRATREFLSSFPQSIKIAEARILLADILLNSKNYSEAITIIEPVYTSAPAATKIFQQATYFRGIELYYDRNYRESRTFFDRAANITGSAIDPNITALARFWGAEASYELRDFRRAIDGYLRYFSTRPASSNPVFAQAQYGLAYAYFEVESYAEAGNRFEQFLSVGRGSEARIINDATLRAADCFFVLKNYDKAQNYYNRIITSNSPGTDYANFQKGMILGLQGRAQEKITSMKNLLQRFANSNYADDAQFEIAATHLQRNEFTLALTEFNTLVQKYPNSNYVPRAYLNIGLIYFNTNDDAKSLEVYRKVADLYPSSPEAKEAVLAIRKIMVDQGDAAGYIDYVKSVPNISISASTEDSLIYQSAYSLYIRGNCDGSLVGFNEYVNRFPNGFFITDVRYYRGDCLLRSQRLEPALNDFIFVSERVSPFTERAVAATAQIYLSELNYRRAIDYLKRLEIGAAFKENYGFAMVGLMNSYNALNRPDSTLNYAGKVIGFDKSSADERNLAKLLSGKSYLELRDTTNAIRSLTTAANSGKNIHAAEATYLQAQIQFNRNRIADAEKTAMEVSTKFSDFDYWVGKSFLLLADVYIRARNFAQARSTLQSLIDNYTFDDDIVPTAKNKLAQIATN